MIIDFSTHVLPPRMFRKVDSLPHRFGTMTREVHSVRALYDMDERFRLMDMLPDLKQVISLSSPPLEEIASPEQIREIVTLANDEMAELVTKHPDRFHGFLASLSLDDIDWSLREMARAFDTLGAVGVQLSTQIRDIPLDSPRFDPILSALTRRGKALFVHPARSAQSPDFPGEAGSLFGVAQGIGWPYLTTVFMWRLICQGAFDRHPDIKIVTHHFGGMLPYLSLRIEDLLQNVLNQIDSKAEQEGRPRFKRQAGEYLRMFNADTAIEGDVPAMECGFTFFGHEKVVFGSDMPFSNTAQVLNGMAKLKLDNDRRNSILLGNTLRLLS